MELSYTVEQSSTDRLTFYLRPNLQPVFNGSAVGYANMLVASDLNPMQRERAMDAWLEHKALMMLNSHDIGRWCADAQRSQRVLINTSECHTHGRIRLRFISATDAALFKLTFG